MSCPLSFAPASRTWRCGSSFPFYCGRLVYFEDKRRLLAGRQVCRRWGRVMVRLGGFLGPLLRFLGSTPVESNISLCESKTARCGHPRSPLAIHRRRASSSIFCIMFLVCAAVVFQAGCSAPRRFTYPVARQVYTPSLRYVNSMRRGACGVEPLRGTRPIIYISTLPVMLCVHVSSRDGRHRP